MRTPKNPCSNSRGTDTQPDMNSQTSDFPLRLGPPETALLLLDALRHAGFDAATLCRGLKIPNLSSLGRVRWKEVSFTALPEPLHRAANLFLFGECAPRADLERLLGAAVVEAFLSTGLLRPSQSEPGALVSPIFLYPVAGFIVASDRHDDPDGPPGQSRDAQPDVVFPAIFGGTLRFLELLPPTAHGEALDLCGGSGIGAMLLGRTARAAVTADITERSTRFAAFNAWLNGCATVESLCGDLYAPVAGRQFDCITAHPPYVPSLGSTMIYRDAGDTGEEITRNIVAGLPAHLRPGGFALVVGQSRDTNDSPYEQRVRAWLGEAQHEFDVIFALQDTKSPEEEVKGMAGRLQEPTREQLAELLARFRRLGTKQFVYGALFLRRRAAVAAPWTARLELSAETLGPDFLRALQWHDRRGQDGFAAWLPGAKLRMSPHLEIRVRHIVRDDTLLPAEFIFETDRPFAAAMRFDGWVAPLLARFSGGRTPAEVHADARRDEAMPADFHLPDFANLVALLVEKGFLVLTENG